MFQTLAERVNGAITRIRSGIDAAQQTAKNLFTPIRAALSGLFGMLRNAVVRGVATARSVVGKVAQPVRDTIDRGMMGRYRQGGLMEAERFRRDVLGRRTEVQNFRESYGNNGIRLRSRTGRFLREDEAISLGPQRALMQQAGDRLKASPNAVPGQKTASRSFPVLPDPWEETKAEQFFKGIAQFLRALRRATPEVEAQTIEFFRSVNEGGDRTLRSVQTIPLGQRIKAALSKKLRDGLDVAARMADRGAGINPPRIKQAKPPEIAGLLPPASGMPTPQNSERAANGIARAFVQAATRAKAAWAQTGEEVSGKTWRTMVQRAYQTGLRILGFISEASPGPSRQIRQNYAHTAEEVSKDFHQMEQAAHDAGGEIAATMQHAAQKSSAGIGGIFQRFGAGAMRLGGAGMAIGGAIGAAGFAAQSIGFSLTNLELLDEESGRAIYRFTELLSIVTTIGGLVSPLIGAIASTLGAVLPILVTVGTAVGTFLISPIGIATAAVLGAIVLANEAAKRFLGIDILSSILSRAWEFAHQLVAPLTWPIDWIEQKWQGLVKRFGPTLEPIVAPAFEVGQKLVGSLSENSPGPTFLIRQNWGEAAQSVLSSIDQMSGTATMAGQEITDSLSTSGSNLSSFLNSVAGQQAKNLDNLSSIMSQNVSEFIEFLGVQSTGDATLDKIAIAKGAAGMDTTGIKSKSIDFALKQQGYSSEQIAQVNSIANMLQPSAKRLENSMNRLKVALTELRVALAATTLLQKPVDFRNALLSGKQAASGGTVAKAATEMGGGIRNAITGKVSTAVKPPKSYFGQLKSELKALLSSGESGLLAEIGTFVAAIAASPLAQIGGLLATVLILAEALTPSVNLLGEAFGVLAYGVGIAVGVIDGIIQGLGLQDEMNSIARVVKSTLQPILYLKDVLQRVVQRFQEARGAGQQFGQSIASAGIQAATQVQFAWIRFTTWFMTIPLVSIAMAMGQGLINALNHNPTVVIPLAWEEAVTKIIGWIEKLPLVGGWAGEQLKEGLKPGKWLSQGLHWVASAVDQLKQNIAKSAEFEFKVKVQKPEKKSIPLLPPPPKFNLAEQMSDRTTYFQRGGGLAEGLAPGLQQASYGVQFLTRSFREFGGEAFGALKRLDFAALSSSAQKFGDHARFALGIVTQGFRSMSLSAVAFGIASLVGLGPVNLVLLGIGALVLAIATNFLGLRDVLVGSIRVVIGLLRATVSLVNGAAQIMLGAIKTIVGVVALLGGNLEMMHDGIAMMRRGLEAIATGVAQGLRQSLGGAIQLIRGLLQGLQQTALLAFNSFRNVVMAVWSTFRGLGTTIKAIGSALVAVLTRPQEVWERFLGVANQVASVVQRIVKSPQIAVNTAENLALGKAPTVREAYQMAEFDDRLGAREALGNLAYSTANTLSLVSPTLGAPAMAVLGMVDSIWSANESLGHLKQSYEAIQPAVQQGIQQFMQLGFQNGFAASMTKLLAIAQVGLAKTMAIVGAAAKFMWKAITGPLAPVILGIGLVIAAIVALVMAFRRGGLLEVLRPFRDAWYILADAVGDVLRGIGIALNQLANALMLPFEPLLNLFGISGGGGLGGLIANTFRLVLSPLSLVAQGIGLVIRLIGGVVIGIIQVAAVVTRALLLPVAGAIAWIVQAVQGAGRGIAQGFGGAIANITRPIAHLFESLWITLRNVGDSLVEPFEPLLQLFGTSGAGGLGQLLGNAFRLLLSPLGLITTVIGTMVRLVGVVLVGALRLVGTVLKPIIHLLVAPVLLLGQLIRGIFSMARAIVSLMLQSIQMIWALMPPPLKWAIEVASKGVGLLTGGAAPTQPQRFAQGGLVTGPGGGDRIPALLQRDEFVVTAAATRQNYGFLDAINSGVPAEEALKILPTAAPAIVQLMPVPVSTGAVAATPTAPTVQVVLNFNGNIVLTGGSGTELADEMMQHLGPRMEMAVREALRNMVERMR
ncbi:MAG: hypothetical protein SNJ81_07095 [Cyanobacteriota bacterium]